MSDDPANDDTATPLTVQQQVSDPFTGTHAAGPMEEQAGDKDPEAEDEVRWSFAARWILIALVVLFLTWFLLRIFW